MLNVIFFGSSQHSVTILESLLKIKDFNVSAVFTKEDKPVGREQTITPNPVADFARKNNLKLFQPQEFNNDLISTIHDLKPDLGLCVAYGPPYFTQEMIDIPKYKIINIHPSPLPKYRGATPGPWQIINGETKSAVTFFQIDALPDHGPIIDQIPLDISENETAQSFYEKAFAISAKNLESILKSYVSNPEKLQQQDHTQKTYFPKLNKDNAQIDWNWDLQKIERFIRALNPWPIAWTYITNNQDQKLKMKVFSADFKQSNLLLKQVQIEGKKICNWTDLQKYYQIVK